MNILRFGMEDKHGMCIKIPLTEYDITRLTPSELDEVIDGIIFPRQEFIDVILETLFQSDNTSGLFYSFIPTHFWIETFRNSI